jgi:hypothetical protein
MNEIETLPGYLLGVGIDERKDGIQQDQVTLKR